MTRKNYSREYQGEAVQLVTARGVSISQAARDLDLHVIVLRRWVHEFGSSVSDAFPGKKLMKPEDEEVRNLRREVAKLKAERDILKKAVVGSTGQGNGSFEGISRRLEARRFPRPRVEPQGNLIKVTLGVDG